MGVLHKTTFSSALSALNIQFLSGVFNIRLLVSFLPVTGVHWENVCQNSLELYLLIGGSSHIMSAKMGVSWTSLPSSVSNGQLLDVQLLFLISL